MEEVILKAMARSESPKKVRNLGFIPGVLHDSDANSTSVQFETAALNKIIVKHGHNAKVWVELDSEKKFGFIKEVQRHPVEGKVIHIAIQMLALNQEVKMNLPIIFHGRKDLEHKTLQLQVYKAEMEVMGKATLMPDSITVDVSKKELGDNVTISDFVLPDAIKVIDQEDEIYANVKEIREVQEEVVETPEEEVTEEEKK